MKKGLKIGLCLLLAAVVLALAACSQEVDNTKTDQTASDATLKSITVNGNALASLGTPAASANAVVAAPIYLSTAELADPQIVATPTAANAKVSYGLSADTSTEPENFVSAVPTPLTDGQVLWVKVVSSNNSKTLYYKFVLTTGAVLSELRLTRGSGVAVRTANLGTPAASWDAVTATGELLLGTNELLGKNPKGDNLTLILSRVPTVGTTVAYAIAKGDDAPGTYTASVPWATVADGDWLYVRSTQSGGGSDAPMLYYKIKLSEKDDSLTLASLRINNQDLLSEIEQSTLGWPSFAAATPTVVSLDPKPTDTSAVALTATTTSPTTIGFAIVEAAGEPETFSAVPSAANIPNGTVIAFKLTNALGEDGYYLVHVAYGKLVSFNLNGAPGTAPTPVAVDDENPLVLPAPTWEFHRFDGWFPNANGTGTEITENSAITESITAYAKWTYVGGTPTVEGDTLVHNSPMMENGLNFAGSMSTTDGTVSFTAGAFQYKFPDEVLDYNSDTDGYPYFIVQYELKSATGSASGIHLRQYGTSAIYQGLANQMPWLSNQSSLRFEVSGSTTDGFSIYHGGSGTIEVKINSITFYKVPKYTVTFDFDGGNIVGGTNPPASRTVFDGYSLGSLPAPVKADHTLIGWKNGEGNSVGASTPITGSWTLTAQWAEGVVDTSVAVTADENDTLFGTSAGSNATKYEYDGKQWWIFAKTPPGSPAKAASFTDTAAYDAIISAATANYTRVSIALSSIDDDYTSFDKVRVTYDLIQVASNNELTLTVRNGNGAGGEPDVNGNQTVTTGTNQTVTFNVSSIGTGRLAFVKRNSGGDAVFLMRITEVRLLKD